MTDTRQALLREISNYIMGSDISQQLKLEWCAAIAAQPVEGAVAQPNSDEVICPDCAHQFRAIHVNVQRLMLDAGFEPPFTAAPKAQAAPAPEPSAEAECEHATIRYMLGASKAAQEGK